MTSLRFFPVHLQQLESEQELLSARSWNDNDESDKGFAQGLSSHQNSVTLSSSLPLAEQLNKANVHEKDQNDNDGDPGPLPIDFAQFSIADSDGDDDNNNSYLATHQSNFSIDLSVDNDDDDDGESTKNSSKQTNFTNLKLENAHSSDTILTTSSLSSLVVVDSSSSDTLQPIMSNRESEEPNRRHLRRHSTGSQKSNSAIIRDSLTTKSIDSDLQMPEERRKTPVARLHRRLSAIVSGLFGRSTSAEEVRPLMKSLTVRMPDGRISTQSFAANTSVRHIIANLMPHCEDLYEFCLFGDDSTMTNNFSTTTQNNTVTFLDRSLRLIDIDRIRESRCNINVSLVSTKRILNVHDTLRLVQQIGYSSSWLIDTPEVCALVESVANEFSLNNNAAADGLEKQFDLKSQHVAHRHSNDNVLRTTALSLDEQLLRSSILFHYESTDVLTVRSLSTRLSSKLIEKFASVGLQECFVTFAIYYGDRPVLLIDDSSLTVHRTNSLHLTSDASLHWKERISLDVPIRDLPRESYVDIRLCAKSALGSSGMVSTIGWSRLTIFDHSGRLRDGTIRLTMWPNEPPNNVSTYSDNVGSFADDAALLEFQFDTSSSTIFWKLRQRDIGGSESTHIPMENLSPTLRATLLRQCSTTSGERSRSDGRLIWQFRRVLTDRPHMLAPIVLAATVHRTSCERTITDEIHELLSVWSEPKRPVDAIPFLGSRFVDIELRRWAVVRLERLNDDELSTVFSQLIESLQFDLYHDSALFRFLLRRAIASRRLIGQQLLSLLFDKLRQHDANLRTTRFTLLLELYLRIDSFNSK